MSALQRNGMGVLKVLRMPSLSPAALMPLLRRWVGNWLAISTPTPPTVLIGVCPGRYCQTWLAWRPVQFPRQGGKKVDGLGGTSQASATYHKPFQENTQHTRTPNAATLGPNIASCWLFESVWPKHRHIYFSQILVHLQTLKTYTVPSTYVAPLVFQKIDAENASSMRSCIKTKP